MRAEGVVIGEGLAPGEVERIAGDPASGYLILCDHASNAVPADLGALGLPPEQFQRHIAYDIGAAGMTRAMAAELGCPALLTTCSRLVIDPNRGAEDPTLVMRLSDGAIVPGNARLTPADIADRLARFYRPYDRAIEQALAAAQAAGRPPLVVALHSFTPAWRGAPRPWHVGILWDGDGRLARPLIAEFEAEGDLVVGDNEPYRGGLPGDTIDRHATRRGLMNALIEVRQDLIAAEDAAEGWGRRLARVVRRTMVRLDAHVDNSAHA